MTANIRIRDFRLDRFANTAVALDIAGLDSETSDLVRDWLRPFFVCEETDEALYPHTVHSWKVVVFDVPRMTTREFLQDAGQWLRHSGHVVEIARQATPARTAALVLRLCRALFKCIAVRLGGVNLHGAAVALRGRGFIITGQRGAGKTTVLLNALREGKFGFVANDQMVAIPSGGGGTRIWSYPALLKIRRGTELYPLRWQDALWYEKDTVGVDEVSQAAVFASGRVCNALGSHEVGEVSADLMIIYRQGKTSETLQIEEAAAANAGWAFADFPLQSAYKPELLRFVDDLTRDVVLLDSTTIPLSPLRTVVVECGAGRIDDFLQLLPSLVTSDMS